MYLQRLLDCLCHAIFHESAFVKALLKEEKYHVHRLQCNKILLLVCQAETGDEYTNGTQFGMIKFGSGTELYVPVRENLKCCVQKGDKVKAGLTVLAKYE